MKKIVEIAHDIINDYINEDSEAVDFTMGNGFDTIYLAQKGKHVYSFDIQLSAILNTRVLLDENNLDNATLIFGSHEYCERFIYLGYDVGIFNFGYLPNENKVVTTLLDSSKRAVQQALHYLRKDGVLVLVLYPGHGEGKRESEYFKEMTKELNSKLFKVIQIEMWNQNNAPHIIAIEKR